MMIAYVITFISFILDLFLSNYISLFNDNSSFLIPMFTLTSLIITMPFFKKDRKKYIIYSLIYGGVFDLCVTNTFPLNIIIFGIISWLIIVMDEKFSYNLFINIIKLLVIVFIYDAFTYCTLLIIGYLNYSPMILIFKYLKSIALNILFLIMLESIINYLVKKYKIKRTI